MNGEARKRILAKGRELLDGCLSMLAGDEALAVHRRRVDACLRGLALREARLVLLGEAAKGKSELVNALLGERILPTGPVATTRLPQHLRWASETTVELVDHDGGKLLLGLSRTDLGRLDEIVSALSCSRPFVRISLPAPILEDGLVIIDTPGTNDLDERRRSLLYEELPAADAALIVLDSRYVLTSTEAELLRDLLPDTCRERLIFVLSKADRLDEDERREVCEWAREGLERLGFEAPIYLVSASDRLDGKGGGGIDELLDGMARLLDGRAWFVLDNILLRAAAVMDDAASCLESRAAAVEQALKVDREKLDGLAAELEKASSAAGEALSDLRSDLNDCRDSMLAELDLYSMDFRKALPGALEGVEAEDVRKYLPFFIRDSYKEWLQATLPATRLRMENVLGKAAERLDELLMRVGRSAGIEVTAEGSAIHGGDSLSAVPKVEMSAGGGIGGYDMGIAALSVLGGVTLFVDLLAGGILTAVAAAAAVQFKFVKDGECLQGAMEKGRHAIDETGGRVRKELVKGFDKYRDEVLERLEASVRAALDRVGKAAAEAEGAAGLGAGQAEARARRFRCGARSMRVKRDELLVLRLELESGCGRGPGEPGPSIRDERKVPGNERTEG